jgi:acyl dehydratase
MEESGLTLESVTFGDLEIGRAFGGSVTIEAWHLDTAATLFRDFNPLHTDEETAARSMHGRRIVHGTCSAGIMMGTIGNTFAGTGLGLLETNLRYKAPGFVGDTLTWEWVVTELAPKPRLKGGVATFAGSCRNQDRVELIGGRTVLLVADERIG